MAPMSASPRLLPEYITIPGYDAYQVRIVRGAHGFSATFAWSRFSSQKIALQAAVEWRDLMLAKLPSAGNGRGGFRTSPMPNKHSFGRVGITRYAKVDRRRLGSPVYLVYGVNWTDSDGGKRVKQFQVGRIGTFEWHQELHASLTAEAFRTEWEFCRSTGQVFEPDRYDGWSEEDLYPFLPTSTSSDS
ncbi:AP2/ERF domain-containing protein (plasmid) [Pseudomonas aeruginosa]|nr:AP2/ERF domain-containing protein [Pseudomonas aeruginosa]CAI9912178.1 AP2/ERF domain-containing protein [Pseudomonas aeruginosa]